MSLLVSVRFLFIHVWLDLSFACFFRTKEDKEGIREDLDFILTTAFRFGCSEERRYNDEEMSLSIDRSAVRLLDLCLDGNLSIEGVIIIDLRYRVLVLLSMRISLSLPFSCGISFLFLFILHRLYFISKNSRARRFECLSREYVDYILAFVFFLSIRAVLYFWTLGFSRISC